MVNINRIEEESIMSSPPSLILMVRVPFGVSVEADVG
jgi:hypothetical protein